MTSSKQILFIIALMLVILATATIVNVGINFRDYAYKNVEEKAQMTAEVVRSTLTSHMVNGTMDKRLFFLASITRNKGIDDIWVVRSDNVIKQFGKGLANESPRDRLDEEVLNSGKVRRKIVEHADSVSFRITIPYTASQYDLPNCLTCHNAKEGETLGAISMTFDISDIRNSGTITLFKIFAINIVFMIIALFLANRFLRPYIDLFEQLKTAIAKALKGEFSQKITTSLTNEAGNIVHHINRYFEKMSLIFGGIQKELAIFIPSSVSDENSSALDKASNIIYELSDTYKFKKTIEFDETKEDIYGRIIHLIENKFKIKKFVFSEINRHEDKIDIFYTSKNVTAEDLVCIEKSESANGCRAYRTDTIVVSSDFDNLCHACASCVSNYICKSFHINAEKSILLSIFCEDTNSLVDAQEKLSPISSYFDAAKPVLESKILMKILKDSSLKDSLTGLYNRRFLDQFVEKAAPQALRSQNSYAVMMIDIDYFKMVNDSYGHDIGDEVIRVLSKILKDSIRESDLAIRFGGEEFMVLLYNASMPDGVLQIAHKIKDDFSSQKFRALNEEFQKTLSIGIANFPDDSSSIWKVIKYADTALYEAKNSGRDRVVMFETEMYKDEEF